MFNFNCVFTFDTFGVHRIEKIIRLNRRNSGKSQKPGLVKTGPAGIFFPECLPGSPSGRTTLNTPGVTVDENPVVSASAVVSKNDAPNTIVGSDPAKTIRSL